LKKSNLPKGKVPLERALSKLGIASRTQARELICSGKVSIDGIIKKNPLHLVTPEKIKISIDGKQFEKAKSVVLMLHKPRGVVTTRSDEKGRPTVFSLLKNNSENLHAIGRLDLATTGLLLLTNNTKLSAWLTDPKNNVPRTYIVTVRGLMTEEQIELLKNGIMDEGEKLQASGLSLRKASRKESHLTIELTEGKNREIRRMFLAIGHEVTKLKRIAFGGLNLGSLEPGESRKISTDELNKAFDLPQSIFAFL
jgi:23S rRNA pseudouridine2605 synthase